MMRKLIALAGLLLSFQAWSDEPLSDHYSVAQLSPEKQVAIRSEVTGIIEAYHYESGDPVTKGKELLVISSRDYALNQNLARFEQDISESELDIQEKQLKRFQSLFKTRGISASDLDNQLRLTNISRAQYNVSVVKYDIASETLKKSAPKAPFDGVIIDRTVELGQFISIGDPLYTIADTRQLKARFYLLEADFNRLTKGDSLKVMVPSTGQIFTGHITLLIPAIQADAPGFLVEVSLDNRTAGLYAGMESRVYLGNRSLDEEVVK